MADQDQGQAPDPTQSAGQQDAEAGSQGAVTVPDDFDPERAMRTILAQRESENALKAALAERDRKLQEFERSKLSEEERREAELKELQAERDRLSGEVKVERLKAAAAGAASKAGALYPDLAHRLIDPREVQYDDSGLPTNVESLMDQAKKDYPELFKRQRPGSPDGGGRANPPAPQTLTDVFRQRLGERR